MGHARHLTIDFQVTEYLIPSICLDLPSIWPPGALACLVLQDARHQRGVRNQGNPGNSGEIEGTRGNNFSHKTFEILAVGPLWGVGDKNRREVYFPDVTFPQSKAIFAIR